MRRLRYLDAEGAVAHEQECRYRVSSFDALYRDLSGRFDPARHRRGSELADFEIDDGGVTVALADGATERCDLLVGADGIGSRARQVLLPEVEPRYAGYVAWRGTVVEQDLSAAAGEALLGAIVYHLVPHGHFLAYPIPNVDGSVEPGRRLTNWLWYRNVAEGEDLDALMTDRGGVRRPVSLAPGAVAPSRLEELRAAADGGAPAAGGRAGRGDGGAVRPGRLRHRGPADGVRPRVPARRRRVRPAAARGRRARPRRRRTRGGWARRCAGRGLDVAAALERWEPRAARARPRCARAHAARGRARAAHRRVAGRRAAALGALRGRRLRRSTDRGPRRSARRRPDVVVRAATKRSAGPCVSCCRISQLACHPHDRERLTGPRSWLWTAAPSDLLRAPGLHSRRPKALPAGRRHRMRCTPRAGRSRRRRRLRRNICGRRLRTRRRPRGPRHAIDVVRHGAVRRRSAHEATV